MDNKHLQQNVKSKKVIRRIGWTFLGIGLACSLIGFADFFGSMSSFEEPELFFLSFIGVPLCGIGGGLLMFGYMGQINRYVANEVAPVKKDIANYMLDGTRDELAETVSAIKNAINTDKKSVSCPKCGHTNSDDSKYCSNCGATLSHVCPYCSEINDSDARFCKACGRQL